MLIAIIMLWYQYPSVHKFDLIRVMIKDALMISSFDFPPEHPLWPVDVLMMQWYTYHEQMKLLPYLWQCISVRQISVQLPDNSLWRKAGLCIGLCLCSGVSDITQSALECWLHWSMLQTKENPNLLVLVMTACSLWTP